MFFPFDLSDLSNHCIFQICETATKKKTNPSSTTSNHELHWEKRKTANLLPCKMPFNATFSRSDDRLVKDMRLKNFWFGISYEKTSFDVVLFCVIFIFFQFVWSFQSLYIPNLRKHDQKKTNPSSTTSNHELHWEKRKTNNLLPCKMQFNATFSRSVDEPVKDMRLQNFWFVTSYEKLLSILFYFAWFSFFSIRLIFPITVYCTSPTNLFLPIFLRVADTD